MLTSKRLYVASLLVVAILAASLQGRSAQAAPCNWTPNGSDIYYICGKVGIGLVNPRQKLDLFDGNFFIQNGRIGIDVLNPLQKFHLANGNLLVQHGSIGIGDTLTNPGERLHIGDGNILLEGAGETALINKRDITYTGGPSGISQNPRFMFGRIIQAGDKDPEIRILYADDHTTEGAVFEVDRKGIVASVKQGRGSHFEGFISRTDPQPVFRLNSHPKMRLEMGAGGTSLVDVAIQREAANTLTFITGATERLRIDPAGVGVTSGYLKLATSAGAPPRTDCDNASEVGRMKVDASSALLYVCGATGWGKISLVNVYP